MDSEQESDCSDCWQREAEASLALLKDQPDLLLAMTQLYSTALVAMLPDDGAVPDADGVAQLSGEAKTHGYNGR